MKRTRAKKQDMGDPGRPIGADSIERAHAVLRNFRGSGAILPQDTTPERLLHARGAARIETFERGVEVQRHGRIVPDTVAARRLRIEDAPLDRLQARGLLASGTHASARGAVLFAAAERYRRHWYHAGLQPLRSLDISRERVSGGQGGLLRTERQLAHFEAFARAADCMAPDVRGVVDAVVLHDREPVDVGRYVSGYRQEKQATAVALHVLRGGLAALAAHFGLFGRVIRPALPAPADETDESAQAPADR